MQRSDYLSSAELQGILQDFTNVLRKEKEHLCEIVEHHRSSLAKLPAANESLLETVWRFGVPKSASN